MDCGEHSRRRILLSVEKKNLGEPWRRILVIPEVHGDGGSSGIKVNIEEGGSYSSLEYENGSDPWIRRNIVFIGKEVSW
jgi:hypothetical protein